MQSKSHIHEAILLIGPTGSGKSPLGDDAETAGFGGRRCLHFDFGHQLRLAASQAPPENGLDDDATTHIREILATSALLEDSAFHIAERILQRFIAQRATEPDDMIILNGLPRHTGQAKQIGRLLRVRCVISLECPPEVVFARIRHNSGGDRTGRRDDDVQQIRHKLAVFTSRTEPLLAYYRQQQVPIITHTVTSNDKAADIWSLLSAAIATSW